MRFHRLHVGELFRFAGGVYVFRKVGSQWYVLAQAGEKGGREWATKDEEVIRVR